VLKYVEDTISNWTARQKFKEYEFTRANKKTKVKSHIWVRMNLCVLDQNSKNFPDIFSIIKPFRMFVVLHCTFKIISNIAEVDQNFESLTLQNFQPPSRNSELGDDDPNFRSDLVHATHSSSSFEILQAFCKVTKGSIDVLCTPMLTTFIFVALVASSSAAQFQISKSTRLALEKKLNVSDSLRGEAKEIFLGILEGLVIESGNLSECLNDTDDGIKEMDRFVQLIRQGFEHWSAKDIIAAFGYLAESLKYLEAGARVCGVDKVATEIAIIIAELAVPGGWLKVLEGEGFKVLIHFRDITDDLDSAVKHYEHSEWFAYGKDIGKILGILV